jgi:hypothetical protein
MRLSQDSVTKKLPCLFQSYYLMAIKVYLLLVFTLPKYSSIELLFPAGNVPGPECWELCSEQLAEHYEPSYGGFSLAPKFPQPSNLMFSFHVVAREPASKKNQKLRDMVLHTLNMMERGGIHDHVGKVGLRHLIRRLLAPIR